MTTFRTLQIALCIGSIASTLGTYRCDGAKQALEGFAAQVKRTAAHDSEDSSAQRDPSEAHVERIDSAADSDSTDLGYVSGEGTPPRSGRSLPRHQSDAPEAREESEPARRGRNTILRPDRSPRSVGTGRDSGRAAVEDDRVFDAPPARTTGSDGPPQTSKPKPTVRIDVGGLPPTGEIRRRIDQFARLGRNPDPRGPDPRSAAARKINRVLNAADIRFERVPSRP